MEGEKGRKKKVNQSKRWQEGNENKKKWDRKKIHNEIININPGKRVTTKNVQGLDYLVKGEIVIVD